ncbi:MAG: cation:proton antiporter [Chloroherpetonaceae bacterium]|nr:cation:proton antiporter [Chloroherpetonaceae bacterium]MDW8020748.1 cation:proton antiporter [Chloroherpetonaceae bacterium]
MHDFEFLRELVIISAAALVIVLIFQRLKIPSVIGLIVTGILLGQSGLKVIEDVSLISTLAELGVILLLFAIGLEFSIEELRRLSRIVVFGGLFQVLLTGVIVGSLAYWLLSTIGVQMSWQAAALIGMSLAVSSTAICLKLLSDRNELFLPHGKIALGILIFQDIAIVPMMIGVSFLSPYSEQSFEKILRELGLLVLFSLGIVGAFRLVMPRLTRLLASINAKEVLVLGALLLCFGSAYLTSLAGLSLALGAFIAGVIISSTDESHAIAEAIEPMRDALTSLFFVSVGLLLNVELSELPLYLLLAAAVLIVNAALATLVGLALGYSLQVSMMAGMVLAQVGEFSFVLAKIGKVEGIISNEVYQGMLAVIVVTMIVTPALIALAPRVAERLAPSLEFIPLHADGTHPEADRLLQAQPQSETEVLNPHVVIIGYGENGRNIASVLQATNVRHTILDNDKDNVERAKQAGLNNIFYGEATSRQALTRAGVRVAQAVVIGISDYSDVGKVIKTVRELNPKAFVIVRTRSLANVPKLYAAGASEVVTEKFETSIQIFTLLLRQFDLPSEVIMEQQEIIRRECCKIFTEQQTAESRKKSPETPATLQTELHTSRLQS